MSAVERAAEVLAEHAAGIGPISGSWACPCGVTSTNGVIGDGDLTSHVERRVEYRAHVAEALAAAGCLRDQKDDCRHTHTHQPSNTPGGCSCGWNHPGTPDDGDPS